MPQPDLFDLLAAPGPFAGYADKLTLYGQFVGSWDIEGAWYLPGGERRTGKGQWHFRWVLGGRGILDVLFATGAPPDQFGATLRCYDPALDVWHLTWMQPYSGEFVHLVGRKVGERIVAEGMGTDPGRRERWSFTDITPTTFLWLGEASLDGGVTWILEQEMRATRRAAP